MTRKLQIILVGCLGLLIACKGTPKAPTLTYGIETTMAVMSDLYLAQAALKDVEENDRDSLVDLYRSQIATIHKVDMAVVEEEISKLQEIPELYAKVHGAVMDSLVMMNNRLKTDKKETVIKKK